MSDEKLLTGIAEFDKLLSEPGSIVHLDVFVGLPPGYGKTVLWQKALEARHTAVSLDLEMAPEPVPDDFTT